MTGAPVPRGADAVVMIEQCLRNSDGWVSIDQPHPASANTSETGCEARAGDVPLKRGQRL